MSGNQFLSPGTIALPAAPAGVTVTGRGRGTATVDTVTIRLDVTITRPDAGAAFEQASTAVTAVLGILADHGVDSRSVKTEQISLNPRHDFGSNTRKFVGYDATQRLAVTREGLATVGALLTDLASRIHEGLRVNDLTLTAANPREAEATARAAAMIDAREKAVALAAMANRPLGAIIAVQEEQTDDGIALMAAEASVGGMPVSEGDAAVTAAISVHFAWAD